jgi:hypothetical protein
VIINGVDTQDFGIRVERLCEFLLDQMNPRTGTNSQKIIEDIKDEAAKLQLPTDDGVTFSGLEAYMRGVPE